MAILGQGGSQSQQGLRKFLEEYFLPEHERTAATRGKIEEAFLAQATTPGSLYGAAETAATGRARELFKPGGEVSSLIRKARGQTGARGLGADASYGNESAILNAATGDVANTFAQQAAGLEQTRFQGLMGYLGEQSGATRDLLESLFTGMGSIEQLGLAGKASKAANKNFWQIF